MITDCALTHAWWDIHTLVGWGTCVYLAKGTKTPVTQVWFEPNTFCHITHMYDLIHMHTKSSFRTFYYNNNNKYMCMLYNVCSLYYRNKCIGNPFN